MGSVARSESIDVDRATGRIASEAGITHLGHSHSQQGAGVVTTFWRIDALHDERNECYISPFVHLIDANGQTIKSGAARTVGVSLVGGGRLHQYGDVLKMRQMQTSWDLAYLIRSPAGRLIYKRPMVPFRGMKLNSKDNSFESAALPRKQLISTLLQGSGHAL